MSSLQCVLTTSLKGFCLALGFSILLTIFFVIRRLWFHQFSKVPGPFLASITSAYSAYHSWRGTMHIDIQRCHQKYGDLIRYAPNQVLSLHPPDMVGIYGHGKPFRKSRGYKTMIPIPDGWSTMTSIDKTLHHNLRRVFRSGVTADSLALYEPAILRNLAVYFTEIMATKNSDGWSSAIDMRAWNLCLGFDTMADFGLGIRTNLLRSPAKDYVFPALHVHEKKMGLWEQLPIFNDLGIGEIVSRVLLFVSSKARLFSDWYAGFLNQAITNNAAKSCGIFGPVIQSGLGLLDKPGHNYAQMIGEGAFSTFSSSDAYGMMLSGFTHYLSHYPEVYKKLATELRAQHKLGETIRWTSQLESNIYLRAVIDEVMRMLPPACGVHWRECERSGVTIGPNQFPMPVGADVGMSLFSLFRDRRIFRSPVRFWPERWLPGTLPGSELSLARKMFTPFLIGPRNCAGGHVALMIASIAFTHLIVNYDFCLDPESERQRPSSHIWSNMSEETGSNEELRFESHYSIAGWESGPFIQFRERVSSAG